MQAMSLALTKLGVICFWIVMAMPLLAAPAIKMQAQSSVRDIGYFIGDVATQTVTVQTPAGYVLDQSSLPALGMDANSLGLLASDYTHSQHASGTQHRLQLSWQNFRAMQEIRSYPLRPLLLVFRRQAHTITVPVVAAHIVVASMLPTMMDNASAVPRHDIPPQPANVGFAALWLGLSLVLTFSLLLSLLWRYDALPWYSRHPLPFHLAWRGMRRIKSQAGAANPEQAFDLMLGIVTLRRAFDQSMGRAASAEGLPQLFAALPWLAPLQSEIGEFYSNSERMLFDGHVHPQSRLHPSSLNLAQLRQLARWLMLLERR